MRILSNDLVQNGIISNAQAIVTEPGHPIENIQDTRLSHNAWIQAEGYAGNLYQTSMYNQGFFTGLRESSSAVIDFDLGAVKDFDTMAIAGNNFTNIDYTISWAVDDIETPDGTKYYAYAGAQWTSIITLALSNVAARYVRLSIADAQQTDTYLQIGRVAIGAAVQMPGIRPIYDVDHITNANRVISQSRQVYGGPVVIYRRVNVSFPNIDDQSELLEFFKEVDLYSPFFVQFDADCPMKEEALYAVVSEDTLPFNFNDTFYTSRLSFEEVF